MVFKCCSIDMSKFFTFKNEDKEKAYELYTCSECGALLKYSSDKTITGITSNGYYIQKKKQ